LESALFKKKNARASQNFFKKNGKNGFVFSGLRDYLSERGKRPENKKDSAKALPETRKGENEVC
jgi:hypothetical protein